MPVERKEQDRVRLMDAFLKETQAFSVLFRLGVLSREEWRQWLRQEYNVPLAEPVALDDGVPDMRDIPGLAAVVAAFVDERIAEYGSAEEHESPEALVTAEQSGNGTDPVPELPVDEGDEPLEPLTDDTLQRLAEEG